MTRIISGSAGGRRLQTPPGVGTRPTSDRVREALFSRLEHLDVLTGARVLDLYAGSGALGLEAASRGAASVLLVESNRAAAAVARANADVIGRPGLRVRAETVERVLAVAPVSGDRVDLALLDPPYDVDEEALAAVLALLVTGQWLAPHAIVVVERSSRSPEPRWLAPLTPMGQRRYGETTIWFADVPGPVA
ncbi:16S rRNA (guanine(966)-N(2))-methyltransferase RsmD [Lapillicoccus sp.]|uniref:16S rRNA (guanine(966)-N(2))-methyltransferase RsmD n=1 Tax=Lapillicoccus sp. TaxID=1909287 RepID=UPI003983A1AF